MDADADVNADADADVDVGEGSGSARDLFDATKVWLSSSFDVSLRFRLGAWIPRGPSFLRPEILPR
jgi:hypothetical protein